MITLSRSMPSVSVLGFGKESLILFRRSVRFRVINPESLPFSGLNMPHHSPPKIHQTSVTSASTSVSRTFYFWSSKQITISSRPQVRIQTYPSSHRNHGQRRYRLEMHQHHPYAGRRCNLYGQLRAPWSANGHGTCRTRPLQQVHEIQSTEPKLDQS